MGVLPRVSGRQVKPGLAVLQGQLPRDVHAVHAYTPEVLHAPHVCRGDSHNLVADAVVVTVGGERELAAYSLGRHIGSEAAAELVGILRFQGGEAQATVVQLVERGHAVRVAVHGAQPERQAGEGAYGERERRGEMGQVVRQFAFGGVLGDVGMYQCAREAHPAGLEASGHGGLIGVAGRLCHIDTVAFQGVQRPVLGQRELPVPVGAENGGYRGVSFLLGGPLRQHAVHVRCPEVAVTFPTVGVFGRGLQLPAGGKPFVPDGLRKSIPVAQTFPGIVHIQDDSPRKSPFR